MNKNIEIERHEPVYEVTAICEAPKRERMTPEKLQRELEKFRKLQDLERFKHLFSDGLVEIMKPCPLCTWVVPEYIKKTITKALEAEIEKLQ